MVCYGFVVYQLLLTFCYLPLGDYDSFLRSSTWPESESVEHFFLTGS